jgi:hypothetical protein
MIRTLALAIAVFLTVKSTAAMAQQDPGTICGGTQRPATNGAMRSNSTCASTWVRYLNSPTTDIQNDITLLLSGYFFSPQANPYMDDSRINVYLRSLDDDRDGSVLYGKSWRDFEMDFNYFHSADTTGYYGKFGAGNPNMLFNLPIPTLERNHVDIYLDAPGDPSGTGGNFYPFQGVQSPEEDGNPTTCDELGQNSIEVSGAGYHSFLASDQLIHSEPDPDWQLPGNVTNVTTNHEFQHLVQFSQNGSGLGGFPAEVRSKAAEYLAGAAIRDGLRPLRNLRYDLSLISFDLNAYDPEYLWGIYLAQHFAADTTRIEDDLLYKWFRNPNPHMYGLAQTLANPEYSYLGGSTGPQRLRNLFHDYSLAKWINNSSPSFFQGKYGFTHGIMPSWTPGFFVNTNNPCFPSAATVIPPRYLVGAERVGSDSVMAIGGVWQVTDHNPCFGYDTYSFDSVGVGVYSSDYIQLDAGPYFSGNGNQNTLTVRLNWNPADYPGPGSGNSLRVSAITYSVSADSLYRMGTYVTGITDVVVDSIQGIAQVSIPNFGPSVKSVVMSIDLGEVNPPSGGYNPRTMKYGYSFRVDSTPHTPDVAQSYFVPQSGSLSSPVEGAGAIANARRCPNDDGTQVLKNNARLKIVVRDSAGFPIVGIGASDICVLFNGGTPAQGFTGAGDDSIIANHQFNPLNNCPDVRCVQADAPTDVSGVAYITWIGSTPGQPGVGRRDPFRKWGGYAGDIPLRVLGVPLQGKLTSSSPLGSYTAHVKSLDHEGGRTPAPNQGELVNNSDISPVQKAIGKPYVYRLDFDNNGIVNSIDLSLINNHNNHSCANPPEP